MRAPEPDVEPSDEPAYSSHIGQDRWVAECFSFKRDGYFLDFGAFDGVTISNTLYLERELGWSGICVEPNPRYFRELCESRRSVNVNAALWPEPRLSVQLCDAHGLSSLEQFVDHDSNAEIRADISLGMVAVDTVNPAELIARFDAPEYVEYLSLDTEGSECDILEAIDFAACKVALLTVEHNHHEENKARARGLLEPLGYRVLQNRNDDWFYHPAHLRRLTEAAGIPPVDPEQVYRDLYDSYVIVA